MASERKIVFDDQNVNENVSATEEEDDDVHNNFLSLLQLSDIFSNNCDFFVTKVINVFILDWRRVVTCEWKGN